MTIAEVYVATAETSLNNGNRDNNGNNDNHADNPTDYIPWVILSVFLCVFPK